MALFGKNRIRRNRQPRRLRVEPLEQRELLSIDLSPLGVLRIHGTSGADTASVSYDGLMVKATLNSESASYFFPFVRAIEFLGENGNDSFTNLTGISSAAYGGAGDDTLTGGSGQDWLHGGSGNDTLVGGAGDDTYRFDADSALGRDTLVELAGGGIDTLDFSDTATKAIRMNLGLISAQTVNSNLTLTLSSASAFENLTGGALSDTLTGNARGNTIVGGSGHDVISGLGGNDLIYGVDGHDTLYGGAGNDTVYCGVGSDVVHAGDGMDRVYGEDGADTIWGDAGNDQIYGGAGNDWLSGGDGTDEIYGETGDNTLYGGNGNDYLYGGSGRDTMHGGAGDDQLTGNDPWLLYVVDTDDVMYGGEGNDILWGSDGNDTVHGGNGDDTLYGDRGNDKLYGDAGNDYLVGGEGNDELHGGAGRDALFGGMGDDTLYGDDDADFLAGGAGHDRLYGGAGNDGLFGANDSTGDHLYGQAGDDRFLTCRGDDMEDKTSNDVKIRITNGSSNWTDREVQVLDEAFAQLQDRAGSTRILKDTLIDESLEFIKEDSSVPYAGRNTEYWYWFFGTHYYDREIQIADWDENSDSANRNARSTVIHEIGHNWDSNDEDNPFWSGFNALNDQSQAANDYAYWYGATDAKEDWCTCWEAYFGYVTPSNPSTVLTQKLALVDMFFSQVG